MDSDSSSDASIPARDRTQMQAFTSPKHDGGMAYLTYAPSTTRHAGTYDYYFDLLGIVPLSVDKRNALRSAIKSHLGETQYTFLRRQDNEVAFKTMVLEFFEIYGPNFWGPHDRSHLSQMDTSKGFLCPRDNQRPSSRLVEMGEKLFDWKASLKHSNDKKLSEEKKVANHIDFKAMTGRATDAPKTLRVTSKTVKGMKEKKATSFSQDSYSASQIAQSTTDTKIPLSATGTSWQEIYSLLPRERRKTQHDGYVDTVEAIEDDPVYRARSPPEKTPSKQKPKRQDQDKGGNEALADIQAATARIGVQDADKVISPPSKDKQTPNGSANWKESTPQSPGSPVEQTIPQTKNPSSAADQYTEHLGPPPEKRRKRHQSFPDPEAVKTDTSFGSFAARIHQDQSAFTPRATSSTASRHSSKPIDKDQVMQQELSGDEKMARTIFLVVDSLRTDILQVTIPLEACRLPPALSTAEKECDYFFSTLMDARHLSPEDARKVTFISATYTWNGKGQALRRGNAYDWERLCKTIDKAWKTEGFDDECEVEMTIHVS